MPVEIEVIVFLWFCLGIAVLWEGLQVLEALYLYWKAKNEDKNSRKPTSDTE